MEPLRWCSRNHQYPPRTVTGACHLSGNHYRRKGVPSVREGGALQIIGERERPARAAGLGLVMGVVSIPVRLQRQPHLGQGQATCEGYVLALDVRRSRVLTNSLIPQRPSSRPKPERFTPPKGRPGRVVPCSLT